jgi:hypothetical protein
MDNGFIKKIFKGGKNEQLKKDFTDWDCRCMSDTDMSGTGDGR